MAEEERSVIIDNGSYYIRAGFSGTEAPQCILPPISKSLDSEKKPLGEVDGFTPNKKELLISDGEILNYDILEQLWNHFTVNDLRGQPSEFNFVVTDYEKAPLKIRKRMAEIMFEKFGVSKFQVVSSSVASLISAGSFTGVSCDIGYESTRIFPVFEGFPLSQEGEILEIGGKHITEELTASLRGGEGKWSAYIVPDMIKKGLRYTFLDGVKKLINMNDYGEFSYEIDERNLSVPEIPQKISTEILFDPNRNSKKNPEIPETGIHVKCMNVFKKCEPFINLNHDDIVLTGGTSSITGIGNKFIEKMKEIGAKDIRLLNNNEAEKNWNGAGIYSSIDTFVWMTKEDWKEERERCLYTKAIY